MCRPTAFFTYGGEVAWREQAGDARASFSDELDNIGSSRRLRAALDTESGWIEAMIKDAHEMLIKTRIEHPEATGRCVCHNSAYEDVLPSVPRTHRAAHSSRSARSRSFASVSPF